MPKDNRSNCTARGTRRGHAGGVIEGTNRWMPPPPPPPESWRCEADPAAALELCRALPKAELHAHINGCIRRSTLAELCRQSGVPELLALATAGEEAGGLLGEAGAAGGRHLTLSECFEMFGAIHGAVCTVEAAARVAAEVVEDFAADNVRYCELRTTPRPTVDSRGRPVDRAGYIAAVSAAVVAAESRANAGRAAAGLPGPAIVARLLLSVDRSGDPAG